jgi:SAM-dependent methyltransferase
MPVMVQQLKKTLLRLSQLLGSIWWRLKYRFWRESFPQPLDGQVRLNLGSGDCTSSEFINIDARPFRRSHLIADIQYLPMFADNSVDLIYASHVVEHIPRSQLLSALKEWCRILKPGGVFRFGVPDFDSLIEIYKLSNKRTDSIINQLMGQEGEYDRHYTIWNESFASDWLRRAGFKGSIRRWNPDEAPNHSFIDKCNRQFKEGDRVILISLNLEVTK